MENRISITTPEYIYLEYETAGIGSRALAAAIDGLITIRLAASVIFLSISFFLGNFVGPGGKRLFSRYFGFYIFTIPLVMDSN